jgi:hypothetical protein
LNEDTHFGLCDICINVLDIVINPANLHNFNQLS